MSDFEKNAKHSYHILIIDDVLSNQLLLKEILSEKGYTTSEANNGDAAFKCIIVKKPDLILLDVKLPEIDGFEVCKQLKKNKCTENIPIIFISSLHESEDKVKGFQAGCVDYISKPFQIEEVLARVECHCKLNTFYTKYKQLTGEIYKAKEEIIQKEKSNNLILEKISDVVWLMNLKGQSIFVTPSITQFTGYTVNEYLLQSIDNRFTPDSAHKAKQLFSQELVKFSNNTNYLQNYNTTLRLEYKCKDGSTKWGELLITPYFDDSKNLVGIHGVTRDVTKRIETDLKIIHSNIILTSINEYANELTSQTSEQLEKFIINKLKEYTLARIIALNIYSEKTSELICTATTLSKSDQSKILKVFNNKIIGLRSPVNAQTYNEITTTKIGQKHCLHEVTFGAIPKVIATLIQKIFNITWFTGIALMQDQKLIGTLLVAGKKSSIIPDTDFLHAFAAVTSNALIRKEKEIAFNESEQKFTAAFLNSPASISITSCKSGKYIDVNQKFLFDSEFTYDEIIGKTSLELDIFEDYKDREQLTDDVIKYGNVYGREINFKTKTGKIFQGIVSTVIIKIKDKPYFLSIVIDISNKKQDEKRLKQNEAMLNATGEIANVGGWEIDIEANILKWTKQVYTIHELDETFTPTIETAINFYSDESKPLIAAAVKNVIENGTPFNLELTIITAKNNIKWVHALGKAEFANAKICRIIGIFQDITEQKNIQTALKKSEAMLNETGKIAKIGGWEFNPKTNLQTWTKEVYKIHEIDFDFNPNVENGINFYAPGSKEIIENAVIKAVKYGEEFNLDLELITAKDKKIWVQVIGQVEKTNNIVSRVYGTFQDITERKIIAEVQNFMLTCGHPRSGEDFFHSLARFLSHILKMEYVCIDKLEGDGLTAKTLAIYNNGNFDSNVSYALKETPCGDVVRKTVCCFPENVCDIFPHDQVLKDLNAISYIGTTLWSYDGKAIGLIAVIGQKPLKDSSLAEKVLQLVSMRAAGELERTHAEDNIKKSEEKFRSLVETTNDIIWETDINHYLYVSPQFEKILGYTANEVIGHSPFEFMPEDEAKKIKKISDEIIASETQYEGLINITLTKSGEQRIFETSGVPIFNTKKVLIGFRGISHDVTIRKQAEDEMVNQKNVLEAIFKSSPFIMMLINEEKRVKKINHSGTILLGKEEKDIIDQLCGNVFNCVNSFSEKGCSQENECKNCTILNSLTKTFSTGESLQDIEGTIKFKSVNGINSINIQVSSNLVKYENSTNVLITIVNITDRKLFEEELINAKMQAEKSENLKTAFLANMSHEIRTPLNSLIGYSEFLIKSDLSINEQIEYALIINKNSHRLLHLINNIMDISKIEANEMHLQFANFNINKLIKDIYDLNRNLALNKGINFTYTIALSDENAFIYSSEIPIFQIISNFLSNAFKFTSKGEICFGYKLIEDIELTESKLEFFVKDTGIGISKEYIPKIFTRFSQENPMLSRKFEGAGLGLSIAKGFADIMNGSIHFETELGSGSTFYFSIPYIQKNLNCISEIIENGTDITADLSSSKILIVEDDEASYKLLKKQILRETKILILHAENGISAIEILKSTNEIICVLMDLHLPGMDGFSVTKKIKEINKKIPVIAVTAAVMPIDQEKALEAGCDAFFSKPIDVKKLISLLAKFKNS